MDLHPNVAIPRRREGWKQIKRRGMGHIKHEAIVVTSSRPEHADMARKEAIELGLITTPLVKSESNGYVSFLIAPDGSKEGWADSDKGDAAREKWKEWTHRKQVDLSLYWVHIAYAGDDCDETAVVDKWPK